jgi:MOSC domain-containing protein YiiM
MEATLIAISVGQPRTVDWRGKDVLTSIFKEPVEGKLHLAKLNLDGDKQADLTVHGGETKAVYVYPAEHYDFWRAEVPELELSAGAWGAFGENFTTRGLHEDEVHIGDRFRVGSAEVQVTEPRMPCAKLAVRFQRKDMTKRFLKSGRTGFYFRVLQEGEVQAGDTIEFLGRVEPSVPVSTITRLYTREIQDEALLRQAAELEALPESWREHFRKGLERGA